MLLMFDLKEMEASSLEDGTGVYNPTSVDWIAVIWLEDITF